MKKIRNLYVLMLIIICTACDDPYKGDTFVVYDIQPASTYLSSRPEDFSKWVEIMKYADLYNAINQATEYFTLFVPNNKAVEEFYQKKGVSSIEELGKEYARNLIGYHVIQDTIDQQTFIETEGELEKKTISEDYLSVSYGTGEGTGGLQSLYLNKEAHVIELANVVSNGYVYVLDDVLTPLTESVYERLSEKSEYSLFKTVLDATGLATRINTIYEEVEDADGKKIQQKRNYTLLAVTDDVFHQDGITSLESLAQKLGANSSYTDPENELYKYVAYHIISGSYALKKLQSFDTEDATSKLWNTLSEGNLIKISDENGVFYFNYYDKENRATFIEDECNLQAKNGYIHQISAYLPVAEPEPETVLYDICDYEEIANWIAAGNVSFPEMKYQTVHSTTEGNSDVGNLGIYQWNAPNPSPFRPANLPNTLITYFTAKSNNDWKDANNHDFLMINLGNQGWISMQTPTIMKGKYKITMAFGHAKSMDFIAKAESGSNGGRMDISFDGENTVTCYPYMSDHKTGGSYNFTYTIYEELEFTTTTSHTFKLILNDPVASTNASYRIMIDYILFEPIIEE